MIVIVIVVAIMILNALREEEDGRNECSLDIQRFIQKIFPSKNGKERLKQLEKLR